jgi:hypothetical protein
MHNGATAHVSIVRQVCPEHDKKLEEILTDTIQGWLEQYPTGCLLADNRKMVPDMVHHR